VDFLLRSSRPTRDISEEERDLFRTGANAKFGCSNSSMGTTGPRELLPALRVIYLLFKHTGVKKRKMCIDGGCFGITGGAFSVAITHIPGHVSYISTCVDVIDKQIHAS
jgi:hypothetical protein